MSCFEGVLNYFIFILQREVFNLAYFLCLYQKKRKKKLKLAKCSVLKTEQSIFSVYLNTFKDLLCHNADSVF